MRDTIRKSLETIDAQIARSRRDRRRMTTVENDGRHAVTHYQVLEIYNKFSLVQLTLETGRLHQIRVHLQHIGHPVHRWMPSMEEKTTRFERRGHTPNKTCTYTPQTTSIACTDTSILSTLSHMKNSDVFRTKTIGYATTD